MHTLPIYARPTSSFLSYTGALEQAESFVDINTTRREMIGCVNFAEPIIEIPYIDEAKKSCKAYGNNQSTTLTLCLFPVGKE
jgi:hypothetical protein